MNEPNQPLPDDDHGLVVQHSGDLIIRGRRFSQQEDTTETKHGVLVKDNEKRAGYILCFVQQDLWLQFHQKYINEFNGVVSCDWDRIQTDKLLHRGHLIALKDAVIHESKLPTGRRESFNKREIQIRDGPDDEYDLVFNSHPECSKWMEKINDMGVAKVEEALRSRFGGTDESPQESVQEGEQDAMSQIKGNNPGIKNPNACDKGNGTLLVGMTTVTCILAVVFRQYKKYLEELERKRLEEQQMAEQARSMAEEASRLAEQARLASIAKIQQIGEVFQMEKVQETMAEWTNITNSDEGNQAIGWIATVLCLLVCICLFKMCMSMCQGSGRTEKAPEIEERDPKEWRRSGADSRLYSVN